jgi:hypothetical protein
MSVFSGVPQPFGSEEGVEHDHRSLYLNRKNWMLGKRDD